MTTTTIPTPTALDGSAMRFLAGCHGTCITMLVPAHHPGSQDGSRRDVIQSLIRTAREEMGHSKSAAGTDELLAPLEELLQERDLETGGPAFVIFRSLNHVARYYVPGQHTGKVFCGEHFYLAPFVQDAFALPEVFVLGLSKKHLRLFRYANGECQELSLPAAVPPSLEAASGLDQPEHNLESRSPSGPSTGSMRAVRFGSGTDRGAAGERLHHFFALVDRGLTAFLGNKSLLLLGVHEEVAEYRRTAKHPYILASDVYGNVEFASPSEIAPLAQVAIRTQSDHSAEHVLADYRDTPNRGRTLEDVPALLQAAGEGRVHRLCVRAGADLLDPRKSSSLNAVIVDTLRTGGEVFMVPQDKLPSSNPLAAILRY